MSSHHTKHCYSEFNKSTCDLVVIRTDTVSVNAKLCEGLLVIRTSNILKITGPKPLLLVRRIFCIFVIFLNKNA